MNSQKKAKKRRKRQEREDAEEYDYEGATSYRIEAMTDIRSASRVKEIDQRIKNQTKDIEQVQKEMDSLRASIMTKPPNYKRETS